MAKGKTPDLMGYAQQETPWDRVLELNHVFRDGPWGDIWVTTLEKGIVNSGAFRPMGRIRQLGTSHLVYQGANHTRLEHSLGTLHAAQRILDGIQMNAARKLTKPIEPRYRCMVRLTALLHDLAHTAFGHTLEDEGNLFGDLDGDQRKELVELLGEDALDPEKRIGHKQWLSPERRNVLFPQIADVIHAEFEAAGIPKNARDEFLRELLRTLVAEEVGEAAISTLDAPFVADIVGNTICADLLDYLRRDAYYTGLSMEYDERIFAYFTIHEVKGKRRATLLLQPRKKVRLDAVSACIDLLKLRYNLNERVYTHRVKALFSAIIIKMADCALRAGILTREQIREYGDDGLVALLATAKTTGTKDDAQANAAKLLAMDYLARKKYRVALDLDTSNVTVTFRDHVIKLAARIDDRREMEETLRDAFADERIPLSAAAFIIYAPRVNKGKIPVTKVTAGDGVMELNDFCKDQRYTFLRGQIESINDSYSSTWKGFVLVRPDDLALLIRAGWNERVIERCIRSFLERPSDGLIEILAANGDIRNASDISWEQWKVTAREAFTASGHPDHKNSAAALDFLRAKRPEGA